jgi:hypothetical protein
MADIMLAQYVVVFSFVKTHVLSRINGKPYQHPRWVLGLRLDFQGPLASHEQGLKVFEDLHGRNKKVGQYLLEGQSQLSIYARIFGMMSGTRKLDSPE